MPATVWIVIAALGVETPSARARAAQNEQNRDVDERIVESPSLVRRGSAAQLRTFDVREVIEDVADLLAEQAQSKQLELACFIDDEVPHPRSPGTHRRLRSISS